MAEREKVFCQTIYDPACSAGLQSTWGFGNQLFVFPGRKPTLYPENQLHCRRLQEIREVRWDIDLYHPVMRKLVNESHNIFVMLQKHAAEKAVGGSIHPLILKSSRQYIAVLIAYSDELKKLADATIDEDKKENYLDLLRLLKMSELIWSLCEILFLDSPAGGLVITQLLDWIRIHFTDEETILQILQEERPDCHQFYWDTVYRLVLQGQIDHARRLLSKHTAAYSDNFQSIDDLLKRMPIFSQMSRGHSVAEFDMKWRHWQDDAQRRLEEREFAGNKQLRTICRILAGEEAVFTELQDICGTWYHMLVSKMLYQHPTVKAIDLQYYVQSCLDVYRNSQQRLGELDNILLVALEFDIHQVIKESSSMFSNWWFVAHLTDLLQHCGQLEAHKLQYGSNLREFLLLDYASSLMSNKSLWVVGVSYLDHCPEFGRHYLENFIENMPIETERKAQKLLNICKERNMTEQARSICKVVGMRHLNNKRLGAALTWFLRSKDVAFATVIAEKFLLEYSESGSFTNLDLIDNLGPSMLLSNRLTFLGKYREFHKLYEDGDFFAAGSLLLSLLDSRLAPKEFWLTLLKDAIPLLEARELIFSSSDTYQLMHCLEELTKEFDVMKQKDGKRRAFSEHEKEKLDLLKLGLTRNLSRAIVTEGSIKLS